MASRTAAAKKPGKHLSAFMISSVPAGTPEGSWKGCYALTNCAYHRGLTSVRIVLFGSGKDDSLSDYYLSQIALQPLPTCWRTGISACTRVDKQPLSLHGSRSLHTFVCSPHYRWCEVYQVDLFFWNSTKCRKDKMFQVFFLREIKEATSQPVDTYFQPHVLIISISLEA